MLSKYWQKWSFDSFEREILSLAATRKSRSDAKLFIQLPADYYYFALYAQVIKKFIKETDCQIIGIWPPIFTLRQKRDILLPIRIAYDILNYYLTKRKWLRLYKSIGVDRVVIPDRVALTSIPKLWLRAFRIWKQLRTKQDVIEIAIDGIYCGDLIYDTYLRYRVRPTVKVKSISMLYYTYKAHTVLLNARAISDERNVLAFFSSYSTYIQHGIPVRAFLQKGISVYTSGNLQQRFKKLTTEDFVHTANHHSYKNRFDKLDSRMERIAEGTAALERKFSGVIDKATGYMKTSAFGSGGANELNALMPFDGVLFLHDFYDSPHIYSSMLFTDFYEWILHTLKLIEKNNLKVLIKPHPNQVADSSEDIETLKRNFPALKWINPSVSNTALLKSGMKFGISLYGTVLHELAYHGITAICAGDNPHTSFSFIHYPKTVDEYDWLILNHAKLKMPEDYRQQVAAFYYMHNIYTQDDFEITTNLSPGVHMFNANSELASKSVKTVAV
jgi:hypothetical protein